MKINMPLENGTNISETQIGLLAYQLWEAAGHPMGRDLDFWLQAETQLQKQAKPTPSLTPVQVAINPAPKEAVRLAPTEGPAPRGQRPLKLRGSSVSRRNHRSPYSAMS